MWDVLHRAIDVEGAGDPGKNSALTRLGKAVRDVLRLRDDPSASGRPDAKAAGRDTVDDEQGDKDAAGGDTPADDGGSKSADDSDTMSNDNDDPFDDAPQWAKELRDGQEENSKRIDEALEEKDVDPDDEEPFGDAPEWAKELKENQDKNAERIDAISKQTGTTESQQLGGTEKGASGGDDKNTDFTLDPRKAGGN
jgi:hypothetical protein